jgi:hypothetical protein
MNSPGVNSTEERLREALRAQAEEFTAHPGAWRQLTARRRRRGGPRWRWSRLSGPALIPVAAAVAVMAVIGAALLVVRGVSGGAGKTPETGVTATATQTARQASPSASPGPEQVPGGPGSGPAGEMLTADPPLSAIVQVRVPGIEKKVHGQAMRVTSYFWLGRNNPATWSFQVNPGQQLCNDTVNDSGGGSSGFCWPAPAPGPRHLATVTGSEGVQTDQTIMVGEAVSRVASVTAVLSDGRTYHGVVATGRGLPGVVWAVSYPWSAGVPYTKGAHLVFRDASGQQVTVLEPHAPVGPPQAAQPATGGVTLFSYPASHGEPAGSVQAYLIHGAVGFWSPIWGGTISQRLAAGAPVLGGLTEPFGIASGGSFQQLQALGYAHANVARIVLRAGGRQLASVATMVAGWPGSSLRLWHVRLPLNPQQAASGQPTITATAYDAAGHVLGQVKLGQMP